MFRHREVCRREAKMPIVDATVRQVVQQFCLEFLENPYLCYTEHGLHALFFTRLYQALPDYQRYTCWEGQRVSVLQKEYPSAHPLGKPKRQGWDIALIKTPPESSAGTGKPAYDYLRLAAVVEFGLNEAVENLEDDLQRLCHDAANVDHGFLVHLYRLSESGSLFSGRDWPANSARILSVDEVADVAKGTNTTGKPIEIFYGLYDRTGRYLSGIWWITRDEIRRLDQASAP